MQHKRRIRGELGDSDQPLAYESPSRRRLTWSCCIVLELLANGMISIVALESPGLTEIVSVVREDWPSDVPFLPSTMSP